MSKEIDGQGGFALIAIIIAILIITVIVFGFINQPGQIEQSREVKNKAADDLKAINENLKKDNQSVQNSLEDKN